MQVVAHASARPNDITKGRNLSNKNDSFLLLLVCSNCSGNFADLVWKKYPKKGWAW